MNRLQRVVVAFALLTMQSACSHMRAAPPPAAAQTPAAANSEPAPTPEPETTAAAEPNTEVQSSDSSAAQPACTCVEARAKPRPRAKPKPKPAHREVTPQPPTEPVVPKTAPATIVDAQVSSMSVSVTSILGKRVDSPKGEDLGRVVDVLADADGRVRIAIIDFGGFLGVGIHRIAVDWPLLHFNPDGRGSSLVLSLSRAQLQTAPEYKDNPRPQILTEPAASPTSAPVSPPPAPAIPTPAPASPSSSPPATAPASSQPRRTTENKK